jgi:acyl-CoA reductase-like NAD-dependent aldehyde dehydrogenase
VRELNAPFGGFKASGVGREGGAHSWANVTQAKTIILVND